MKTTCCFTSINTPTEMTTESPRPCFWVFGTINTTIFGQEFPITFLMINWNLCWYRFIEDVLRVSSRITVHWETMRQEINNETKQINNTVLWWLETGPSEWYEWIWTVWSWFETVLFAKRRRDGEREREMTHYVCHTRIYVDDELSMCCVRWLRVLINGTLKLVDSLQ